MATIINNTTSGDAQFVLDPDFSIYSKNFSGISGKYAKVDSSGWMSDTWFFGFSESADRMLVNWSNYFWIGTFSIGLPLLGSQKSYHLLAGAVEVIEGSAVVNSYEGVDANFIGKIYPGTAIRFDNDSSKDFVVSSILHGESSPTGSTQIILTEPASFSSVNFSNIFKESSPGFVFSSQLGWFYIPEAGGSKGAWFWFSSSCPGLQKYKNFADGVITTENKDGAIGWVFCSPNLVETNYPASKEGGFNQGYDDTKIVQNGATYVQGDCVIIATLINGITSYYSMVANSRQEVFVALFYIVGAGHVEIVYNPLVV